MKNILLAAPAAHRRIRGWIGTLEDFAVSKHGSAARKIVNEIDTGGDWTNTLVYDADTETHYIELTAAELAALSANDTVSWAYISSTTRYTTEQCQIVSNDISGLQTTIALLESDVIAGDIIVPSPTTSGEAVDIYRNAHWDGAFYLGGAWSSYSAVPVYYTAKRKQDDADGAALWSVQGSITNTVSMTATFSLSPTHTLQEASDHIFGEIKFDNATVKRVAQVHNIRLKNTLKLGA